MSTVIMTSKDFDEARGSGQTAVESVVKSKQCFANGNDVAKLPTDLRHR